MITAVVAGGDAPHMFAYTSLNTNRQKMLCYVGEITCWFLFASIVVIAQFQYERGPLFQFQAPYGASEIIFNYFRDEEG